MGRRLEGAIQARPTHPGLRAAYAFFLAEYRRFDEAVSQASRAVALDPMHQAYHNNLGMIATGAGRYELAIEALERSLELSPHQPWAAVNLAEAYHRNGMDGEALGAMLRWASEADNPLASEDLAPVLRRGFEEGGFAGGSRALVNELAARSGDPCTALAVLGAILYADAEQPDPMFRCLDEAIAQRGYQDLFLGWRRAWDPYRDDPRFTALLRRMNLAE